MPRFRKKPVEVEAVQWTGDNINELWDVFSAENIYGPTEKNSDWLIIATLEGDMRANVGDWIIKGVIGELYPCKPDVFAETYDPLHAPEITAHPAYSQWCTTGKRIRAELGATNANHASWIPHPFAGEGLPVCAACEHPERSEVHQHDCAESGCHIPTA